MQVSNSTGQNTDYRVGTSSGGRLNFMNMSAAVSRGIPPQESLEPVELTLGDQGQLPPGGSETFSSAGSFSVEFFIAGERVAFASYQEDPGQVVLVEENGQYFIQVQGVDAETVAA